MHTFSLRKKGGTPRGDAESPNWKHSGAMKEAEYSPSLEIYHKTKLKRKFDRRHRIISTMVTIVVVGILWYTDRKRTSAAGAVRTGPVGAVPAAAAAATRAPKKGGDTVLSGGKTIEWRISETVVWPRIIHQSWRNNDVPITAGMNKYVQTWMGNPCHHAKQEWTYQFWNNSDNERFIAEQLPKYLETYQNLTNDIARADFSRYAYLYVMGGVYADLDFECRKSFEDLLKHPDVATRGAFLSSEPWPQSLLMYGTTDLPCNAIMGSKPKHQFWKFVMDKIQREVLEGTCGFVVACTGPIRLQKELGFLAHPDSKGASPTTAQKAIRESIAILSSDYFYPLIADYKVKELRNKCLNPQKLLAEPRDAPITMKEVERGCKVIKEYNDKTTLWTSNTYAAHHWGCTWCHPSRSGVGAKSYPIEELVKQPALQRYGSASKQ